MRYFLAVLSMALLSLSALGAPQGPYVGGGTRPAAPALEVSQAVRARLQAEIRAFEAMRPGAAASETLTVEPWKIFPQAGNLDEDLYLNGFVDLDPTDGVRDWMCGTRSYDGHQGVDSDIRSFVEQAAGVPIFAALDGTVAAAHDGEWDQQTSWLGGANANYVTISHGAGQYSLYFHLRKGSVAVKANDTVKAGQQIGMTGSSGRSTWPHLHFESQVLNAPYEPFTGACNPEPSRWREQPQVRTDMFVSDLAVNDASMETYAEFVFGWPRNGTFTTGPHRVTNWFTSHHMTANTTWSARYHKPDGSVLYASPTFSFGNPFYSTGYYWIGYDIDLAVAGTWSSVVTLNSVDLPPTPFFVVPDIHDAVNHPPAPVTAAFDPPAPGHMDPVFCRVRSALLNTDPDYDVVRYRYQWTVDGTTVRDVTTAARSDAIPGGLGAPGALLRCTVTPFDALVSGDAATQDVILGGFLIGDVDGNGTVDRLDAVLSLRLAGGLEPANAAEIERGGVGAAGFSVRDVVRLARRLSGL